MGNIQVPADLSIVGYDDSFLSVVSEVKLTSISHPKSRLGKQAAETILNLINSKEQNNFSENNIIYAPELKIRHSTKEINERSEEHTSELQSRGHIVCRL